MVCPASEPMLTGRVADDRETLRARSCRIQQDIRGQLRTQAAWKKGAHDARQQIRRMIRKRLAVLALEGRATAAEQAVCNNLLEDIAGSVKLANKRKGGAGRK